MKETGNLKHLYRNELDKACFAHDAAHSDSKDLAKRTIRDKILKDRANEIARNRNYDVYQRPLASTVYKIFDKKTGSGISLKLFASYHPHHKKKFTLATGKTSPWRLYSDL